VQAKKSRQNAGNEDQAGAFMQYILCLPDVAIETPVNGVIMAQTAAALQKATVTATGMCPAPVVAEFADHGG
jgi:hypothetical protein